MKTVRNTHIICTMGPVVASVDMARSLIRKGMNIARFNFSHGNHEEHGRRIAMVRQASEAEGIPVALMLDTKGPEIRTGVVKGGGCIELIRGEPYDVIAESDAARLFGEEGAFTQKGRLTVSYTQLADDVKAGARILIADGLFALAVNAIEGRVIKCTVEAGGEIGSKKNVNILGVHTRLPAMSEQDKEDLLFGHQQGMDYVSASFIRKASDVTDIQKYLAAIGSDMQVISKIEDDEGLSNIEDIIRVSAGVMVARGDLGVQIPPEQVPIEQKRIITLCNLKGKPVITATQMLDSMIRNPSPTRAEAGDVANAILDGADCVMLSGETANGAYPELAVEMMDRIARTAEASEAYEKTLAQRRRLLNRHERDLSHVIAEAATLTADSIEAVCIVTPTLTGRTAQLISKYRPKLPIVAAVCDEKVRRRLLLWWGVSPVSVQKENDSEAVIQGCISAVIKEGFARTTEKVVITAGLPLGSPLTANCVRVHLIGAVLRRGAQGFGGRACGRIVRAVNLQEAATVLKKKGGEILVTHTLDESFTPIIRIVDGVILEGASELPEDYVININPNIVYVEQVPDAMRFFEEHITVTIDGAERTVYEGMM
ncbi:MAG: pyruvate kinase [Treponema sp.]|jgi:pyruvate kinase|nr:pyruvate kinase [Treponema sp.]